MLPQIRLQRHHGLPLHAQLAEQLRRLIQSGELCPGDRLPPTREAAREFGVARNVVTMAYEELRLEGYLQARVGRGTWVTESLHAQFSAPPADAGKGPPEPGRGLSSRGSRIARQRVGFPTHGLPRPFRPGSVAAEHFPQRIWRRLSGRVWRREMARLVPYSDPAGDPVLRRHIADHLMHHRAVHCHADQIVVTSGSQQALDLVARLLLDDGDIVGLEDPGYLGARAAFAAAGARLVPIPVDEQGLDVDAVEGAALDGARIIYTTCSHQYPLGMTMSLDRRLRLLAEARRTGAWILEDDYDCEFRYGSRALPALQGLDGDGRVIYVGTFSKVLAPSLRVGFLVLPESLVEPFVLARPVVDHHPPVLLQAILAEFMGEGHLARHVARMRPVYAERREHLTSNIRRTLGDEVTVAPSSAGLHLCVLLPRDVDDVAVADAAASEGVEAPPLSAHLLEARPRPGLVLGFGSANIADIAPAVGVLARALEATRRGGGPPPPESQAMAPP